MITWQTLLGVYCVGLLSGLFCGSIIVRKRKNRNISNARKYLDYLIAVARYFANESGLVIEIRKK